jgi:hypothetical protein
VAALLLGGCTAAAEPLSSARYARIVADAAAALERIARSGGSQRAATATLARIPQQAQVVTTPGAPPFRVDNRRLLAGLKAEVVAGRWGIETAAQTLRNLQYSLQPASAPAPSDPRQALARVMRRGEFKRGRLDALSAGFYRWIARIIDWIINHFPSLPSIRGLGLNLRTFFIVVLAMIAALTLYFIVRLVLQLVPRGAMPGQPARPPSVPIRPHAAWLAEAEAALTAGDYRAAMRALHMAALMKLDEAGRIRYLDSRTDGGFVRALRDDGRDDLADALGRLSRLFAYCWYGMTPAGPDEYAAAREQWVRLEALSAS